MNPNYNLQTQGLNSTVNQPFTPAQQIANTQSTPGYTPPIAPTTINSTNTQSNPLITIPPTPTPSTLPNATGTIASNRITLTPPVVEDKTNSSNTSSNSFFDSIKSTLGLNPPSVTDQYSKIYGITPEQAQLQQQQAQGDLNTKNQAVKDAQGEFNALKAQLDNLNYQSNVVVPANAEEKGRGLYGSTGVNEDITRQNRDIIVQQGKLALPILTAQAKLASAQGNATLAQGILQQANDHIDSFYKAQVTDAQNMYQYKTDLINKVTAFATDSEKTRLDNLKTQNAQNFSDQQNNLNYAQGIASQAISNGQGALGGKILALDPKSPTYRQDVANLAGQIQVTPKTTPSGSTVITTGVDPNGDKSSIDNDVAAVLSGRNTLYNIRQTMGRTNAAAAYMQSMRNAITKVDPNFDFVASDAGGKAVSQAYFQKSIAAINSVLPNIQTVVDLSNQVSRIGVAGVDALIQKGAVQIGSTKVANFRQAQKLISDEIGLALGAGTVSDMKLQLGFDVTDPSVSQEVFASNMNIVKDFVANRKAGLESLRYSSNTVSQKGSQSDASFVESSLNNQNINYQTFVGASPKGQIPVIDNKSGQAGYIPLAEFNSANYTKV